MHLARVLDQQIAQIGGGPVGGRQSEQHQTIVSAGHESGD
jgi:hypothetical protein